MAVCLAEPWPPVRFVLGNYAHQLGHLVDLGYLLPGWSFC